MAVKNADEGVGYNNNIYNYLYILTLLLLWYYKKKIYIYIYYIDNVYNIYIIIIFNDELVYKPLLCWDH